VKTYWIILVFFSFVSKTGFLEDLMLDHNAGTGNGGGMEWCGFLFVRLEVKASISDGGITIIYPYMKYNNVLTTIITINEIASSNNALS